jgi:transcriptional regulator with XRE-family HTH domain
MPDAPALDIDAILIRHGLSRGEFCEQMGLSMSTIRSWHRGDRKPSLDACQLAFDRCNIGKHELRPDVWPTPPPAPATTRSRRNAVATA